MTKNVYVKILVLVVLAFQLGCLKTRSQVRELETIHEQKERFAAHQKAEALSKVDELSEQNRELRGRIESLETRLAEAERAREEVRIKSENMDQSTKDKLKVYEETIEKLEAQLKDAGSKATAKAAAGAKQLSSYDKAELQFNNKDWKEAVLNYQKYRDQNPKGVKYSDATYKIGVAFQELGMKTEAKAFYDEVIEKFPKSQSANRAKTRIKSLK